MLPIAFGLVGVLGIGVLGGFLLGCEWMRRNLAKKDPDFALFSPELWTDERVKRSIQAEAEKHGLLDRPQTYRGPRPVAMPGIEDGT